MRVKWKCEKCKAKTSTLGRTYPAMHWCKAQLGKYLPLQEVDNETDA